MTKSLYTLTCFGLCILVYKFGVFSIQRITDWTLIAGILDWPIFMTYASQYINAGVVYETNIALYGPGEPIYKFPPLFLSTIIFFLQQGFSAEVIKQSNITIHIVLYFSAALVLMFGVRCKTRLISYLLLALIVFSFEPFFDNFARLQLEIYVLFLLCLGIVLLIRDWNFWSGICFGVAAGLKIYPIFFCAGILLRRNYRVLFGMAGGFIATLLISLTTISAAQHWHYFAHVLPFMLAEPILATNENVSIGNLALLLDFPADDARLISRFFLLLTILVFAAGILISDRHGRKHPQHSADFLAWKIASGFALLISGFIFGSQNIWWSYQLLLLIPLIVIVMASAGELYFSRLNLLAVFVACVFIYYGGIGQLDRMTAMSNDWFGDPNIFQPLFVRSVYLRCMGSLLIFVVTIHLYWQIVVKSPNSART